MDRADPEPTHRARADVRSITRRIWWWPTYSQFETAYDYLRIARRVYPDRYRERLGFGPSWFIRLDPGARIPRFTVTEDVFGQEASYFGPFPGRTWCSRYIELLQDLFNLCRHPDILEKVPRGHRCAYYDMGKCSAPCDGTTSLDRYRGLVAYAVQFLRDGPEGFIAEAEQEMRRAAGTQEFERAAATKRRIEQARKAIAGPYRYVRAVDQFRWLIVQRAEGRSRVKPFFVRGGRIDRGESIALKNLQDHVGGWFDTLRTAQLSGGADGPRYQAEHVWMVSHFLFRSDKLPGVFLREDQLPDPAVFCDRVHRAFAPRSRAGGPSPSAIPKGEIEPQSEHG